MEAVLLYIAKASAVLAAFYLLWRFTLKGKPFHSENRLYLLSAMALSFLMPLLVVTFTKEEVVTGVATVAGEPVMREFIPSEAGTPFPVLKVLLAVYCLGAVGVLLYDLISLYGVLRIISSSQDAVLSDGTSVKVSSRVKTPFSFFSAIVIPERNLPCEGRSLLIHEKAHVRLGHSYDIQFCGAVCALQWFNPFVWMLRNDLRSVHEFQADQAVLNEGVNATDYQVFLVEEILRSGEHPLANNFASGNLKNRIGMMNSNIASRRSLARLLLVVPLFAACLLANSRTKVIYVENETVQQQPQNDGSVPFQLVEEKPTFNGGDANEFSKWVNSNLVYPKEAKDAKIQGRVVLQFTVGKDGSVYGVKVLRGAHDLLDAEALRVVSSSPKWSPGKVKGEPVAVTYTFPVIFQLKGDDAPSNQGSVIMFHKSDPSVPDPTIYVDGKKYDLNLAEIDPDTIESISVLKDDAAKAQFGEGGVIMITLKKGEKAPDGGSVPFQLVEEKPTFNGGDANEFSKWVNSNLTYPKEAKDAKIQGRVTMTFTVDSDGSVKDAKVLRGVNEFLDAEALRVISSSPKWEPGKVDGKPVPVTYTFPVIFQLK